jgi:hypothetical protein
LDNESKAGCISKWYKPFISKNVELAGKNGHKACWDCGNLRLKGQPNRTCKIHGGFVWMGDSDSEIFEDLWNNGKTRADTCDDYFLNPEIEEILKKRGEI